MKSLMMRTAIWPSAVFPKRSKREKERSRFGLTTKSVGQVCLCFTIATATSKKLKPPARRPRFFPGAEKSRKNSTTPVVVGQARCLPTLRNGNRERSPYNYQTKKSILGADHQIFTRLSGGRTIGQVSGKLNAFTNSGMSESGPLTR